MFECVIVRGGSVVGSVRAAANAAGAPFTKTAGFLKGMPSGAYTTMRTVGGGTRVFDLSMHMQRLRDSYANLAPRELREAMPRAAEREAIVPSIREAIESLRKHGNPAADGEDGVQDRYVWESERERMFFFSSFFPELEFAYLYPRRSASYFVHFRYLSICTNSPPQKKKKQFTIVVFHNSLLYVPVHTPPQCGCL